MNKYSEAFINGYRCARMGGNYDNPYDSESQNYSY